MGQISGDWQVALKNEFHQPYYAKLYKTIMEEYRTTKVFPPPQDMFNAFEYTPLNDVKVVILGQDPYHNDGQANGLCFSVREDIDIPPSLVNIYKELHSDLGCYIPDNGCLEKWAKQGVFLLNTVLTSGLLLTHRTIHALSGVDMIPINQWRISIIRPGTKSCGKISWTVSTLHSVFR